MVDIKVSKENNDFNEREQKLLEVLLTNLAAFANSQATEENVALNPLDRNENELYGMQLAWQKSITDEQYEDLVEGIKRRYKQAFKMAEISDAHISFLENSYLQAK